MADPKYAGLPGIVQDQPDVYETSDLPEAEQQELNDGTETSDAIEVLHISASDAHTKFADKMLDAARVDFSDRISKKTRTGYQAKRIEWELSGGEEKEENIVQRYNRLMCEVTALQQDVLQLKEKGVEEVPYELSTEETKSQSTVSAVELEQQSQQLQNQLLQLQLEKQLGMETVEGISQPHLTAHKRLSALIDAVKQTKKGDGKAHPSEGQKKASPAAPSEGGLSYQMFYSPEMAKLNQMGPTLLLEKRLESLEKLIGNDQDKLCRLWSWTREGSVLGAVTALGQRMALLEPSQLDHIEGRLHGVHVKMNAIAEKGQGSAEKEGKIQELYDLMQKSWVMCNGLPEVVERLEALQELHNEAGQFGRSLQQLDVAQTQLSSNLSNNEQLLSSVNEKFVANLAAINSSIASLESRIQALDKNSK